MTSSVEPPGADCPTGGVKLKFGRDLNRDGMLVVYTRGAAVQFSYILVFG